MLRDLLSSLLVALRISPRLIPVCFVSSFFADPFLPSSPVALGCCLSSSLASTFSASDFLLSSLAALALAAAIIIREGELYNMGDYHRGSILPLCR